MPQAHQGKYEDADGHGYPAHDFLPEGLMPFEASMAKSMPDGKRPKRQD
jgi:hypothetical protein